MLLLSCLPFLLNAQKMAVGGYVTPTYGNIVRDNKDFDPAYNPVFTIGGGLNFNYYKNRWLINTGLNFKNAGAFQKISITTVNEPEGNGSFANANYSIFLLTLPVGINYAIINNDNFKLYGGIILENGLVLNNQIVVKNKDFNYMHYIALYNNYYIGLMPEIKMEWNISLRTFLFSNIGLSYQLNNLEKAFSFPEGHTETYKINNLFIDFGFGYRL
jgi:hypothetical protein